MKIAVTYDNGAVFQHFGKTEQFKVYTIEDGTVLSSQVLSTEGKGHGALADVADTRIRTVKIERGQTELNSKVCP